MNDHETHSGGWLESTRRIGESLLDLIRSRFELFAVEWQEEKLRLFALVIWLGLGLTVGALGLLVGTAVLALWLWHVAGYWGLTALALAALAFATGILLAIRRQIRTGPQPFAETLAEFRKDGECFQRK